MTTVQVGDAGGRVDEEVEGTALRLLAERHTFFLATSQEVPWVGGAFFVEDGLWRLHLVLETGGTTLRNLRANPHAALVVSSGSPFEPFLQGAADAAELDGEATAAVAQSLLAKAPEIAPLLGAPTVAVRLTVRQWKVTDVTRGWLPARVLNNPAT